MNALRITQWLAALIACLITGAAASAASVKAVQIGTFDNPVYVAVAPSAHDLLFVVEQPGQIQVLRNEQKQNAPFLDIRSLVLAPPDAARERSVYAGQRQPRASPCKAEA